MAVTDTEPWAPPLALLPDIMSFFLIDPLNDKSTDTRFERSIDKLARQVTLLQAGLFYNTIDVFESSRYEIAHLI